MASLNRVQLIGHLGGDPELTMTGNDNAKVTFRLATVYCWRDGEGQDQKETDWHNIVVWNRLAEICKRNLAKGRLVYVEGRLTTRQWERDGQTHYWTEVVATEVQFLDDRRHWNIGIDEEVVSVEDG